MNGRRNSIDYTTTNGQRRNFFHLCGSPNQVRSPETLSPPALNMKDVGDMPKKRATLATAATEQDDLFAAYDTCASSFAMDKSMRMMSDSDDDDYDEGAETDTNSSTHMRVQDAREARIPLFLSDDFLPQQAAGCNGTEGFSRVGGRRGSLTAAHESIDLKDLHLDRVIGEGAFGKVYKGMWKQKPVAVKVLIHQDLRPDVVREFETEVQIMSVLNHPNICMLLGACLEPSNRALVLELVEQGSLWSVLRSRRRQINDAVRAKFILDTAMGMNYLHQFKRPILHRDMKSPNLLVQKDFSIKISDFGLSRVKAQIQTMTGNCGTVQWMAPEVLGNQKYTEKADVFSFGIVIWEICTGRCPYEGMVQIQAALGVLNHDLRPSIPETCPRFFARLMRACWNREPSMRPSFAEIIRAFELYQKSVSSSNFSR